MSRSTKATLVFLVAFLAVLVYLSTRAGGHECEVCVTFMGASVCRTAASETRERAIESAVTSACGTLASGMTESIRCQNTPPDRTTCKPD